MSDERAPEPGFLSTFKWSLVMLAASIGIAAVAIPLLRWLDLD